MGNHAEPPPRCDRQAQSPKTTPTRAREMGILTSIFRRDRVTLQPTRYYDDQHGFRYRRFLDFPLGELSLFSEMVGGSPCFEQECLRSPTPSPPSWPAGTFRNGRRRDRRHSRQLQMAMAMAEASVSQLLGSTQGYGWSSWIQIKTGSMAGPGLCTLRRQTSALKM